MYLHSVGFGIATGTQTKRPPQVQPSPHPLVGPGRSAPARVGPPGDCPGTELAGLGFVAP
jgi:hypothetical protein